MGKGVPRRTFLKLMGGAAPALLFSFGLPGLALADGICPPPNPDFPNWYDIDPQYLEINRTNLPNTEDVNKQYMDMCVYPADSSQLKIAEHYLGGEGVMVTYVPEGSFLNISRLIRFVQGVYPELTEDSFMYTFAPDVVKIPGNPDVALSPEDKDYYIPGGSPLLLMYKDNTIDFPIGDGFTQKEIEEGRDRIVIHNFIEYLRSSLETPERAGLSKDITYEPRVAPQGFEPDASEFEYGIGLVALFAALGFGAWKIKEIRDQKIAVAQAQEQLNQAKKTGNGSAPANKPNNDPAKKAGSPKPPQLGK